MQYAKDVIEGRVPLWVGAVGHRLLRPGDEPPLRMAVRKVLDEIASRWGRELEPCLLSSLAEGADRLIAEEAIARGWQLVAPLPLPIELYEEDFCANGSREVFRSLLRQAAMHFDMELETGVCLTDVSRSGPAKDRQYERAGEFIAETCQILIALWDGEYSGLGTARVVSILVRGSTATTKTLDVLDTPAPKLVYHIWTPTQDRPDPTGIPFAHRILVPGAEQDRESVVRIFDQILQRLIEFHRDAVKTSPASVEQSIEEAIPRPEAASLPKSVQATLRWYGVADAAAIRCQRAVRPALPAILGLAFAAVFALALFTGWPNPPQQYPPQALVAYLAFFGLAWFVYSLFQWRNLERRYLDYRALAEGLRVQLFWRLSGIPDSVSLHYLRRHRGELSWIPAAIAGMSAGTLLPNPDQWGGAWPLGRRRRLARDHWLKAQHRFFVEKARELQSAFRRYDRIAFLLFGVAFLLVASLSLTLVVTHGEGNEPWQKWAFIVVTLLLAGSAAVRYFADMRAFGAVARRYEMMHVLFERSLETVGDDRESLESSATLEILRELGRESLAENGDWLLLQRDRPLQLPTPG